MTGPKPVALPLGHAPTIFRITYKIKEQRENPFLQNNLNLDYFVEKGLVDQIQVMKCNATQNFL
jgi:hypothetical protein